jgi:hypothetical protein
MWTVKRYPLGPPQVSRLLLNSAAHLLWILQGGSRRIRVTYSEGQLRAAFGRGPNLLSAVIPLVHIRVQVDVGNELVEHRSTRLNHSIRELRANADRVPVTGLSVVVGVLWEEGTDEIPRIRLIFPGSTKLRVFTCLMTGHRNCTSPPPRGGEPRFFIFGSK